MSGATPTDLRPFRRFWNRLSYRTWVGFEDAVRTGRGQSTLSLPEEDQRIFSEGVEAIQAAPATALADVYDFAGHERVLDLGGGTGSWLLVLLDRHPQVTGTLFELPAAADLARSRFAGHPAGDRAKVVDGDFFTDPIPGGHDTVLVANVVHLFSPEHNLELLERARQAVTSPGRLLLVDFWTDPTHTDPTLAALMAGEFLVITGEGDVYSDEEVGAWLAKTGWTPLDRRPLAGPISLLAAETAG